MKVHRSPTRVYAMMNKRSTLRQGGGAVSTDVGVHPHSHKYAYISLAHKDFQSLSLPKQEETHAPN